VPHRINLCRIQICYHSGVTEWQKGTDAVRPSDYSTRSFIVAGRPCQPIPICYFTSSTAPRWKPQPTYRQVWPYGVHVVPSGLPIHALAHVSRCGNAFHGLAPMATTFRPFRTSSSLSYGIGNKKTRLSPNCQADLRRLRRCGSLSDFGPSQFSWLDGRCVQGSALP
jgi:hypothetical protein